MPRFSNRSKRRLDTCHQDLKDLMNKVVEKYDITILEGHRNEEKQNAAFDKGNSRVRWPNGKHNSLPSRAVDIIPYPFNGWRDLSSFREMALFVLGTAHGMGINIRWGGDWDSDMDFTDQKFNDLVHFELRN